MHRNGGSQSRSAWELGVACLGMQGNAERAGPGMQGNREGRAGEGAQMRAEPAPSLGKNNFHRSGIVDTGAIRLTPTMASAQLHLGLWSWSLSRSVHPRPLLRLGCPLTHGCCGSEGQHLAPAPGLSPSRAPLLCTPTGCVLGRPLQLLPTFPAGMAQGVAQPAMHHLLHQLTWPQPPRPKPRTPPADLRHPAPDLHAIFLPFDLCFHAFFRAKQREFYEVIFNK